MRNANTFDGMAASMSGHVNFDVMYDSQYGLVHRKKVGGDLAAKFGEYVFLMETAENDIVVALHSSNLRAVYTGSSHTPKKPKRKPVKGTKPWTKIPYKFEDVDVGDVVCYQLYNREHRHVVLEKSEQEWLHDLGGATNRWEPHPQEQAHILKPYKEPIKAEEKYCIGDKIVVTWAGEEVICQLVQVAAGIVKFITTNGNRLNDEEMTHFCSVIRKEDILSCLGGREFVKLEKDKQ